MADLENRARTDAEDGASAPVQAPAIKVNWIPTGVMLAVFVWSLIFGYYVSQRFPDQGDAIRAAQYVLLAAVALVAAPALAKQFAPRAPRAARAVAVIPILVVLTIPLFVGLYWASYDALNPVHPRANGRLPDIGSIVGRSEHDVNRILGTKEVVGTAILGESDVSDPSRPGGADAERLVVYSLPDLNTMQWRPDKQAQQKAETKGASLTAPKANASWNSDAVVIVYYNSAATVVGARADISVREAQKVLSDVTSETVLAALGVSPVAAIVSPDQPDVLTNGTPVADIFWGSGTANGIPVGYQLQIGGMADFLADRTAIQDKVGADLGDVTLVTAPTLTDATHMLVATASAPERQGFGSSDGADLNSGAVVQHGQSSYSNRTFWIIVCSKPLKTEAEAVERAKDLNSQWGKKIPCFSVERSGHLAGLGDSDFWIVIYDVGYGFEDAARNTAGQNPWGFPLSGTWIVNITKQCGDYTISKIVQ